MTTSVGWQYMGVETFMVTVPAPCRWINANDRLHFHAQAKLTRDWRAAARVVAESIPYVVDKFPVRIVATYHLGKGQRVREVSNLFPTAKACIDGLVEAGIMPDDSDKFVVGPDPRRGERLPTAQLVLTLGPPEST